MKKQLNLLLALPASILLLAGLSSQQSSQAAYQQSHSNNMESIKLAALVPGVPVLPTPPHPVAVPTVTKPVSTGAKPSTKNAATAAVTSKTTTKATAQTTKKKSRKGRKKAKAAVAKATTPAVDEVKYVSLTFDDGPSPVYTPQILAILKKEGIHATFCVIGREAKKHPELLQQIVADGNKIADHSMNHDEHLDRRSDKKMKSEILGTKELIESIVPGTQVDFYRAPAGNCNHHQKELLTEWGMKPLGWTVDTKDWQRPSVDDIIATVNRQLHTGGVILMHDSGGNRTNTVEALEKVIPQLKKEHYLFVFPS